MSEIKLNFRISFDLLELATFGTNYGLQTVIETVTRCPKVALRYFVPLAAKRFLEMIDTLVFFSANLAYASHNSPTDWNTRILCGENEVRNLIFKNSWAARAECDGAESY